MGLRPEGAVTFLFTDIVGSTRRWEEAPDSMGAELAVHLDGKSNDLLSQRIIVCGGHFTLSLSLPHRLCGDLPLSGSPIRIGRVPQTVTEEIEGEDGDDHGHDWQHEPGIKRHHVDVLRLVQEDAPAGDGRAQA